MSGGRVTQSMMSATLIRNLNTNLNRMDHLQNQLATGKRINKPSDDPVGISFAMRYRSELAANDQYQSNVDSAISWLENTDTTLGQAGDVLQRVRDLTVQAANGTNPKAALESIEKEVFQLKTQLIDIGNTNFNGKYIFNGQKTDVIPYDSNTITDTDSGTIKFELGVGVKIGVNASGNKVFGSASEEDNAFRIFDELIGALKSSDFDTISSSLNKIDTRLEAVLRERSETGAKINRLELAGARLKDISLNLQTLQTKTEDVDMAEAITNLKASENVYQASLSVGAKLIKPSLIDYLR